MDIDSVLVLPMSPDMKTGRPAWRVLKKQVLELVKIVTTDQTSSKPT
jgi:hypothetical protein